LITAPKKGKIEQGTGGARKCFIKEVINAEE